MTPASHPANVETIYRSSPKPYEQDHKRRNWGGGTCLPPYFSSLEKGTTREQNWEHEHFVTSQCGGNNESNFDECSVPDG